MNKKAQSRIWQASTPTRRKGQTQQANTNTHKTKRETRLKLPHIVDGNDVIRLWLIFRGGQIKVHEYIVQNSRFRLHEEGYLNVQIT